MSHVKDDSDRIVEHVELNEVGNDEIVFESQPRQISRRLSIDKRLAAVVYENQPVDSTASIRSSDAVPVGEDGLYKSEPVKSKRLEKDGSGSRSLKQCMVDKFNKPSFASSSTYSGRVYSHSDNLSKSSLRTGDSGISQIRNDEGNKGNSNAETTAVKIVPRAKTIFERWPLRWWICAVIASFLVAQWIIWRSPKVELSNVPDADAEWCPIDGYCVKTSTMENYVSNILSSFLPL